MEYKKDLEIMMQIKEKENKEISRRYKETGNLDTIINDVRTLGKIKVEKEENGQKIEEEENIYILLEEKNGRVLVKYYNENTELIAVEDTLLDILIPSKEYEEKNQQTIKTIEKMDKEQGKSLSEIEEKVETLEKIAVALGIDIDNIDNIEELDLDQEIGETKNNDQEELTKKETNQLKVGETTSLNENIKGTTLANKLGINNITLPDGSKLTDGVKLARVSSNSLNQFTENKTSMQDAFVVIRANGEAVPLGEDILKPDNQTGINSMKSDMTINNDGTVTRKTNTSSYKIVNGNGNEFLKTGNNQMAGKNITYSQWSSQKGEYVNTELRTNRNITVDDNVRQYLKARNEGTREATDTLEKEKNHEQHGEKEQNITLVDHDDKNDSHVHIEEHDYIPNTNTTWREFANQCGYRGEGALERAYEKFENESQRNSDLTNKQIIEKIEEQENEEFRNDLRKR